MVDHVRTRLEEIVDRSPDRLFIPRDWRGRHDHRIAVLNLYVTVFSVGHLRETCHRFALRPCGCNDERLLTPPANLLFCDQWGWEGEISKISRDLYVLLHGSPNNRDLASELPCRIKDLLNPRNV